MPPTGQYNIFELSSGSVVGISTTATVGVSTTSVIGLTTTSNVGLTTTSNVGLTTTSVVSPTSSGGPVLVSQAIPSSADVVSAGVGSTGTIISIPPNRTWLGSIYVSITAHSTYGAASAAISASISTVGATVTPAAGSVLAALVDTADQLGMTSSGITAAPPAAFANAHMANVMIAVGSSSAFLSLSKSASGVQGVNFYASAQGWLL